MAKVIGVYYLASSVGFESYLSRVNKVLMNYASLLVGFTTIEAGQLILPGFMATMATKAIQAINDPDPRKTFIDVAITYGKIDEVKDLESKWERLEGALCLVKVFVGDSTPDKKAAALVSLASSGGESCTMDLAESMESIVIGQIKAQTNTLLNNFQASIETTSQKDFIKFVAMGAAQQLFHGMNSDLESKLNEVKAKYSQLAVGMLMEKIMENNNEIASVKEKALIAMKLFEKAKTLFDNGVDDVPGFIETHLMTAIKEALTEKTEEACKEVRQQLSESGIQIAIEIYNAYIENNFGSIVLIIEKVKNSQFSTTNNYPIVDTDHGTGNGDIDNNNISDKEEIINVYQEIIHETIPQDILDMYSGMLLDNKNTNWTVETVKLDIYTKDCDEDGVINGEDELPLIHNSAPTLIQAGGVLGSLQNTEEQMNNVLTYNPTEKLKSLKVEFLTAMENLLSAMGTVGNDSSQRKLLTQPVFEAVAINQLVVDSINEANVIPILEGEGWALYWSLNNALVSLDNVSVKTDIIKQLTERVKVVMAELYNALGVTQEDSSLYWKLDKPTAEAKELSTLIADALAVANTIPILEGEGWALYWSFNNSLAYLDGLLSSFPNNSKLISVRNEMDELMKRLYSNLGATQANPNLYGPLEGNNQEAKELQPRIGEVIAEVQKISQVEGEGWALYWSLNNTKATIDGLWKKIQPDSLKKLKEDVDQTMRDLSDPLGQIEASNGNPLDNDIRKLEEESNYVKNDLNPRIITVIPEAMALLRKYLEEIANHLKHRLNRVPSQEELSKYTNMLHEGVGIANISNQIDDDVHWKPGSPSNYIVFNGRWRDETPHLILMNAQGEFIRVQNPIHYYFDPKYPVIYNDTLYFNDTWNGDPTRHLISYNANGEFKLIKAPNGDPLDPE